MVDRVMMQVLGWSGWPMLVVVCVLTFLAPAAESRFFPIRTGQSIENIERRDGRLCWDWVSYKAENRVSDNLDLFIDVPGALGAVGAPFEKETGLPWVRSRAAAPFQWHRQSYCILVPPYVKPSDPITVRQIAYYPGRLSLFGQSLWHVALRMPNVVSGGAVP